MSPRALARRFAIGFPLSVVCLALFSGPVSAQVLIAEDDLYGVPFGEPLVVEPFGVLENDFLDGEPAGENGAVAELVADVSHGSLLLAPDGSFTFTPDSTFDGIDGFVYRARFGVVVDEAAVVLTACEGGPDVYTCWSETAYLAKAAELGYASFTEGFEEEGAWGIARSPDTAPSVVSRGIRWMSNHPDPPASNEVTTGSGPARTGLYGVFDPEHGYATGTTGECDVDTPPEHCLFHDGWTGVLEPGEAPLHGVGGYITGIYGAKVGILIDGAAPAGGGVLTFGHQFFGVIDARPAGFTRFEFRELEGKIGNALYVWADDFTMLNEPATAVESGGPRRTTVRFSGAAPNPSMNGTTLAFTLPGAARVSLKIYDARGREVRTLVEERLAAGPHPVRWDGRSNTGRAVAAGVYFARLVAGNENETRRIVILR